jgi:radical SAM family uncharacterized protein/radical SAM-linked protein
VDFEQKLRSQKIPLYSLENKIPLCQFDIVGFSLLYELNYSNVLTILELGRIPFRAAERGLEYPLVIAGGPACFNPEPLADFFDLFLLGDGEEAVVEIADRFTDLRKKAKEKKEILKELARIKGVYVPSHYESYQPPGSSLLAVKPVASSAPLKVAKRLVTSFANSPFPEDIIVPDIQVIFDRVALEVARGCPQRCRFCQATTLYFPHRVKSPSFVIPKMLRSLQATGLESCSLSALSIGDFPCLEETVEALMGVLEKEKISLSLPSLRPKGLTLPVAENIVRVRKTGFTLVPEAGTERLRRVINKNLSDEDILEASRNAFALGWRLLKLYFMIGLPTENDEDIEGIASLTERIVALGSEIIGSPPGIHLSLSSFIPKPHTPFQWLGMEDGQDLAEKQRYLKARFQRRRNIRVIDHPVNISLLEAVFSRGDRRLAGVLEEAWKRGARFDSWRDQFRFSLWEDAFLSGQVDFRLYLNPLGSNDVLPWDHIETGVKKDHLLREFERAKRAESTPSCREAVCAECQGCEPSLRPQKTGAGPILPGAPPFPRFGQKQDKAQRYRVAYSKQKRARYLSHLDVVNLVQRAFRRAGISVRHSEGFHPKMRFSFSPALPLGMEGKKEYLEFLSDFQFREREFIDRANLSLPQGIRLLSLELLDERERALNELIAGMTYSVDLNSPTGNEILQARARENPSDTVQSIIDQWINMLKEMSGGAVLSSAWDKSQGKILLTFSHPQRQGVRPQDIVGAVLGVERPNFIMAREEIILKKT